MALPRLIPIILIKDGECVKTKQFKNPIYIGDPINTVHIFNRKKVDEIIILDIDTKKPNFSYIENLASEAFMPLSYGGGIHCFEDAAQLFKLGVERIIINSEAQNIDFIRKLVACFGSQSIIVNIDVKKNIGSYVTLDHQNPFVFAKKMEAIGVGEIMVTNVDFEGTMQGYDLTLLRQFLQSIDIPIIANGGAKTLKDIEVLLTETSIRAFAASSMFLFKGIYRAVIITYPSEEKEFLFDKISKNLH